MCSTPTAFTQQAFSLKQFVTHLLSLTGRSLAPDQHPLILGTGCSGLRPLKHTALYAHTSRIPQIYFFNSGLEGPPLSFVSCLVLTCFTKR